MKDPLKNTVIAVTGYFGPSTTPENIKRWIEANGGIWTNTISKDTTHLVCSEVNWKKRVSSVKEARKHRHIKIVNYDWLEDCLQARSRKRESRYAFDKRRRPAAKVAKPTAKKARPLKQVEKAKFDEGCASAKSALLSDAVKDNHHIYRDETGFDYDVTLTRIDIKNNRNERYRLTLYESNAKPHTYSTYLRYTRPTSRPVEQVQAPLGSNFEKAFREFCKVFKSKTLRDWKDRLDCPNPAAQQATVKNGGDADEQPFGYVPPPAGMPRGVITASSLGPEACVQREEKDSRD